MAEVKKATDRNACKENALRPALNHGSTPAARYCAGEIAPRCLHWALPCVDQTKLTIAMMIALNRDEEFRMHVRAAANNGVTPDEIKEVILQAALYCGLPAANSAFAMAQETLRESGALPRAADAPDER